MEQQTNQAPGFEMSLVVNKKRLQCKNFAEIFGQAVDAAFSVLGSQAKQSLFGYFEERFGIGKDFVGRDFQLFAFAIEEVFGQSVRLIEIRIMAELHRRSPQFMCAVANGEQGFAFVDYVEQFQRFCSS
jgi:hypothetical protein